jgi:predicted sugar kinase
MLVKRMAEWGAAGVGQSSWGPAAYGLVEGEAAATSLARSARELMGAAGQVFEGGFAGTGARVWRTEAAGFPD